MAGDPQAWQNHCPGDTRQTLPEVVRSDVNAHVARASQAFDSWRRVPLAQRIAHLRDAQGELKSHAEELAESISLETGKPLTEARGELGAVVAKIDLAVADAEHFIADESVTDGPHPALIRHRARGPAAVIAPFNFPIHLGHGAAVAYLLAGNSVLYKPSPLAAVTGARYSKIMQSVLPAGVFELVQGWTETSKDLCAHDAVRAVCFTGSIPAGRAISQMVAADYSKSLALELGGKNASIVLDDADIDAAAAAIADSICLTTGQRCNATSRILVHTSILGALTDALAAYLKRVVPSYPVSEQCKFGPLISNAAVDRYRRLTALPVGEWVLPGTVLDSVDDRPGHYVLPALVVCSDREAFAASPLQMDEAFCPVAAILPFSDDTDAVALHNTTPFGLTASIFTTDPARFARIGDDLEVGNLYQNLPTTFSPSTLPCGGHGISGNGKPGGRGFIRFAAEDQAVQWKSASPA